MSVRAAVKGLVELSLAAGGAPRLVRWWRGIDRVVLAYHNVVPHAEPVFGDPALHLPQREFAAQLDGLRQTHDVVPLDELILAGPGHRARPRAAITMDDAYRGAVSVGVDELSQRGLPATIFVAPAFLGGRTFWWDRLHAGDPSSLPAEVRAHALLACDGRDDDIAAWAARDQRPSTTPPWHATCAHEGELKAAVAHQGITVGSHSWSHANLARLALRELEAELTRSLEWLREGFPDASRCLAVPYGCSSPAVETCAASLGHLAVLRNSGGALPAGPSAAYAVPRVNVSARLSRSGFELRLSGVLV